MPNSTHMNWQRANVQAAASYLRERIAGGATDSRTKAVYEGLLEVLDPNRRTLRLQRELAASAKAAAVVQAERDRRDRERRAATDRRKAHLDPPGAVERRSGRDRRRGTDRRHR